MLITQAITKTINKITYFLIVAFNDMTLWKPVSGIRTHAIEITSIFKMNLGWEKDIN